MKRSFSFLFALTLLFTLTQSAFAQFEKGDKLFNAGIGGGGYGFYGGGISLGASFEAGITDFISVGAQADFRSYSYGWLGANNRYISLPIAGRGAYHFGKHFLKIEELDLYGGANAGFNIDNNKYYNPSALVLGVFAGGRWYFKPNFGVFAEFAGGTNVMPAKAGITLKF